MKKLITQFIEKLDKDGVFSEEQIKEFESFGATIQTMLKEAESKGKEIGKEEAEEAAKEEMEELEESFKSILAKIDEIKNQEQKLKLIKFRENAELTVKEEEIVEGISKYFDTVISEHLPEQAIIDYAELDRLRTTISNIKEAVIVTNSDVQNKITQVIETTESEIANKTEKLNDAISRNIELTSELNKIKAEAALESKLKDIPDFEQSKLRKYFKESTLEEIEESFDSVLETIKMREYQDDVIDKVNSTTIKEDLQQEIIESDIDRYAKYADRWIPSR